jgi:hypothetical protein
MPLTIPATITLSDEVVATIADAARGRAAAAPTPTPDTAPGPSAGAGVELPREWRLVEESKRDTYKWPTYAEPEVYEPFEVYDGATAEGSVRIAIGHCERAEVWGKDRLYLITFHVGPGGAKYPLCEFLETDDYEQTRELVAIIRGNGRNRRSMYAPGTALPAPYEALPTGVYSDYVCAPGAWKKQAVIARDDDYATMLNHSLIQAELRFAIRPS